MTTEKEIWKLLGLETPSTSVTAQNSPVKQSKSLSPIKFKDSINSILMTNYCSDEEINLVYTR